LGFANVIDPGPPTAESCPQDALYSPGEIPCSQPASESALASTSFISSTSISPTTLMSTVARSTTSLDGIHALSIPGASNSGTSTSFRSMTSQRSSTLLSTSSLATGTFLSALSSSATDLFTSAPSNSESSSAPETVAASTDSPDSGGIPVRIRAVIAVCSILAALTIAALVFLLCRRRRRRPTPSISSTPPLLHQRTISSQPSSPTHLLSLPRPMSDPSSAPLTPPLKLRDRQLLHTPPRSMENGPSGQGTFSMPAHNDFPTSPICAPTINILEPRREKVYRLNCSTGSGLITYEHKTPSALETPYVLVTTASKTTSQFRRDSANSIDDSIAFVDEKKAVAPAPILLSPVRPPRPEELLEVPGLVRPNPGSCKLHPRSASSPIIPRPPIPAMHPGRLLSASLSSTSLHRQKQLQAHVRAPVQGETSSGFSDLSKDSQELCDLTKEYASEAKPYRGASTPQKCTGAPGMAFTTPHRTEELPKLRGGVDLEVLAGTYR
ncbi:hypothetical protein Cpir12675_000947, partial [Ceratocystis pirilliformis]